MSTANNEKQRKKSAPKKIFSEKKRAQKRRHREMTHEEKRQIKFPKEDPGFVFKRITSEEAGKDKMIQDLRAIQSSKSLMKDIRRFDAIDKSTNEPDCTVCQKTPQGIPWVQFSTCTVFSCAPYVPCKDLEERYGPIEYHPKYEGISAEATLARREPFWTDQKRTNEW